MRPTANNKLTMDINHRQEFRKRTRSFKKPKTLYDASHSRDKSSDFSSVLSIDLILLLNLEIKIISVSASSMLSGPADTANADSTNELLALKLPNSKTPRTLP
jgi:hypothetical protein